MGCERVEGVICVYTFGIHWKRSTSRSDERIRINAVLYICLTWLMQKSDIKTWLPLSVCFCVFFVLLEQSGSDSNRKRRWFLAEGRGNGRRKTQKFHFSSINRYITTASKWEQALVSPGSIIRLRIFISIKRSAIEGHLDLSKCTTWGSLICRYKFASSMYMLQLFHVKGR